MKTSFLGGWETEGNLTDNRQLKGNREIKCILKALNHITVPVKYSKRCQIALGLITTRSSHINTRTLAQMLNVEGGVGGGVLGGYSEGSEGEKRREEDTHKHTHTRTAHQQVKHADKSVWR